MCACLCVRLFQEHGHELWVPCPAARHTPARFIHDWTRPRNACQILRRGRCRTLSNRLRETHHRNRRHKSHVGLTGAIILCFSFLCSCSHQPFFSALLSTRGPRLRSACNASNAAFANSQNCCNSWGNFVALACSSFYGCKAAASPAFTGYRRCGALIRHRSRRP